MRLLKWHAAYSVQTDVQLYGWRNKCVPGNCKHIFLAELQLRQITGGRKCRYCYFSTRSPPAPLHCWKFSALELLQPPCCDAVYKPVNAVDCSLTGGRAHRGLCALTPPDPSRSQHCFTASHNLWYSQILHRAWKGQFV